MIIAQVAEPCLVQTNGTEIIGTNNIKFKLLGPYSFNVLVINAEAFADI